MTNFAYTLYLYAANMHFTTRHLAFLALPGTLFRDSHVVELRDDLLDETNVDYGRRDCPFI